MARRLTVGMDWEMLGKSRRNSLNRLGLSKRKEASSIRQRPPSSRIALYELPPFARFSCVLPDRRGCIFIHGLIPFAKMIFSVVSKVLDCIYTYDLFMAHLPGPNGFRSVTPSYIHGFESPKTAQVCYRRSDLFAID